MQRPNAPDTVFEGRILVVGPAWIGDMVIAQSLFAWLKRQRPGLVLDVLALDWCRPILERMPEVDRSMPFPCGHNEFRLEDMRRLGRRLRRHRYDRAIVLRNNLKSALIPWFARIPRRTGFRGEMRYGVLNDIRPYDRTRLTSRVLEYLALGAEPGQPPPAAAPYPALRVDRGRRDALMAEHGLSTQRPVVAIAPGASYGSSKRWPAAHFARLAERLTAAGYAVWIFGGRDDVERGRAIAAGAGEHARNLCGQTALTEAVDLMSAVTCMVGSDSGLTHLAAAVAPRVVALYGPTAPDYAPPLCADRTMLFLNLACSPCGTRECRLGHRHCMTRIDVERVFKAVVQSPASRYTANVAPKLRSCVLPATAKRPASASS